MLAGENDTAESPTPAEANAAAAAFPATLQLVRATLDVEGKPVHLSPGLAVTAEIKTGRRRVIDYLLSPVQRTLGESMNER